MKKAKFISTALLTFLWLCSLAQPHSGDIRSFIKTHYVQGIPYDEAKAFGKPAIPELINMLNEPALEEYWRNVVTVLGYIGDPSATKYLIYFIESSKGEISIHKFRAILNAFQAIGHIAQNGTSEPLDFLKDYTNINTWKTRNLAFSFHNYKGEALSEVMSRQAIQGLGISGTPAAVEKLQQLKQQAGLRKDWVDNVQDALIIHGNVQKYGARKIFGVQNK